MDFTVVKGAPNTGARAWFLLKEMQKEPSCVFLLTSSEELEPYSNALASLSRFAGKLPDFETVLWSQSPEVKARALKTIYGGACATKKIIFISSVEAFGEKLPSRASYTALGFSFKIGLSYSRQEMQNRFLKAGYSRVSFVEERGQCAFRGSVADFFAPDLEKPVRLFFTDSLESIRFFEIDTQHTSGFLESVSVAPACSEDASLSPASLMDGGWKFFADDCVPVEVVGGSQKSEVRNRKLEFRKQSDVCPLTSDLFLVPDGVPSFRFADLGRFVDQRPLGRHLQGIAESGEAVDFGAVKNLNFNSDTALLAGEISRLKAKGLAVTLFCLNRGESERLGEMLSDKTPPFWNNRPEVGNKGRALGDDSQAKMAGQANITLGYLEEGFVHPGSKTAFITSSELFKRSYRLGPASGAPKAKFYKWTDLKIGDFVVHEDYGVGRYLGVKKILYRSPGGEEIEDADCLSIEYSRGDKLMVPLYEFGRVQKYLSSEGKTPRVSHMDTKTWHEMKNRVKAEVQLLAKDILRLEAERAALKTEGFAGGGHLEEEFAGAFPFEETPDQQKAINEVLGELESTLPMNRLVVGDVGFGKTEVAMRAAMRAVLAGTQAAVLVPTTILADQHFRNFSGRFREFPVIIRVISRFETKAAQKKILEELSRGKVDIIIGTHRLLQKDVKFANLGLLIVDEEHRFGVKDKDTVKSMAKGVHALMLSATPIPRTLYQSLSSLRGMSVIESPPAGRLPISTFVRPYDDRTVVDAVRYELARGGQVYYVHNRVRTIETKAARLKELMPEIRVAVVHGQLRAESVEKHMWDFLNRKYDVLLASTIIESGLDIPSVNTLLVENAHELGLAQLYQLRGRIGREKQKAYCYLFHPAGMKKSYKSQSSGGAVSSGLWPTNGQVTGHKSEKILACDLPLVPCDRQPEAAISEDAAKRLGALEEFTELGSGFRLAMRDLEIRGAGELLGVRQHGFINTIGLEMYIKLLNGEINRLKGREDPRQVSEPKIDLLIPAFIPEDYVGDEMERLNFYKKLLNAGEGGVDKALLELEDISGPASAQLKNLAEIIKIRKQLGRCLVRSVTQKEGGMEILFLPGAQVSAGAMKKWQELFGPRITFLPSRLGDGLRIKFSGDPLKLLNQVVAAV
ncbi:MAG: hypothetical protein A2X34_00935 [Elusimicrobia bacterium GWC2_51_8]|nr:MAG: hypothetical protein A2X33_03860 [Elusimicrobia bacterium GWA2_51_34]OGR66393.1 MAG: hypothetical protein A2X34_00935 [Elusimicrobia bacterium GWC2_51_8]OGR86685.1 MAG: hypothetical protein A2021_05750 [Elusimicrobia bacterium GWF2_52_66]HAF95418.1 hypothetical protein [Elusimicrobiota bacterium]HCE99051.1 hypothetical protein [Elusimicrobiota bacterium]